MKSWSEVKTIVASVQSMQHSASVFANASLLLSTPAQERMRGELMFNLQKCYCSKVDKLKLIESFTLSK